MFFNHLRGGRLLKYYLLRWCQPQSSCTWLDESDNAVGGKDTSNLTNSFFTSQQPSNLRLSRHLLTAVVRCNSQFHAFENAEIISSYNADMYISGKFEAFHDLEIWYVALSASYYMTFLLCMDEDTCRWKCNSLIAPKHWMHYHIIFDTSSTECIFGRHSLSGWVAEQHKTAPGQALTSWEKQLPGNVDWREGSPHYLTRKHLNGGFPG